MIRKVAMKEKKGEHPLGDAGQLILLFIFLIVWVSDSFFLRKTTFLSADIPLYIRLALFGLLFIAGLFLFNSSHFVAEGKERPAYVVNTGAFMYIRHPLYMAAILAYLSLTIAAASLAALIMSVVICFFYNYVASYEEQLLVNKFGNKYKDYMRKTGRWIPRLSAKK